MKTLIGPICRRKQKSTSESEVVLYLAVIQAESEDDDLLNVLYIKTQK